MCWWWYPRARALWGLVRGQGHAAHVAQRESAEDAMLSMQALAASAHEDYVEAQRRAAAAEQRASDASTALATEVNRTAAVHDER